MPLETGKGEQKRRGYRSVARGVSTGDDLRRVYFDETSRIERVTEQLANAGLHPIDCLIGWRASTSIDVILLDITRFQPTDQ